MPAKDKILIVEDEKGILSFMTTVLSSNGYDVISANSGAKAITMVTSHCPDLVILDLGLPDMDGVEVLRFIREWTHLPIIVVSARTHERDKVEALDLGADDYVTKPYNPAVLLARIQSVLRRAARTEPPSRIEHKGVVLDVARSRVEYEGRGVELTRNEFRVLHLLMENKGAIISRQELMVELWQSDAFIDDNTLTVNINRLRKSLASIGVPDDFLVTRRGQGYVV